MVKSYQARPFFNAGQGFFREILQGDEQEVGKGRGEPDYPFSTSYTKGETPRGLELPTCPLDLQPQRISGLFQDARRPPQPLYLHFAQGEFENSLYPTPGHYRGQAEAYLTEPILPL